MGNSIRFVESTGQFVLQELLGLQAKVDHDGSAAAITLHTTEGRISFSIASERIAAAHAEIRHAEMLMLRRQTMRRDRGESTFPRLLYAALEPARMTPIVDRATGDRLFVHQFHDRFPIVIREHPDAVRINLEKLAAAVKRAAN